MSGIDDDVAVLATVPPSDFVAARNARAKELRAAKERERAAAVAALRKPTWTAWALAVLAREEPGVVERFLAAGDALDRALAQALAGDREPVRAAQAAERAALADVVAAASGVLAGAGRTAGDQDVQRLTGTLRAAVTDADVRDRLVRGVLVDDVEAPAFGFGAAAPGGDADVVALAPKRAARERSRRRSGPGPGATEPAADDGAEERRRAAAEAEAAERAAAEAEAEAAERARVEAERRAEQEATVARLAEASDRLAAAAEAAEDAARAARAAAEDAAAELADAEAALAAGPDPTASGGARRARSRAARR